MRKEELEWDTRLRVKEEVELVASKERGVYSKQRRLRIVWRLHSQVDLGHVSKDLGSK
jgi:hypothetical protein